MDIIYLKGLQVQTTIGAFSYEKAIRQRLMLDIECGFESLKLKEDSVEALPLNYHLLAVSVKEFFDKHQFALLETAAHQLAETLMASHPILELQISIEKKGSISGVEAAGVRITRTREAG